MISPEMKQTVLELHQKEVKFRDISHILNISRNTIRKIVRGHHLNSSHKKSQYVQHISIIKEVFNKCGGNVVRVQEMLEEFHGIKIPYATLTWLVRNYELREPKKKRAGQYVFGPGEEMQHDTSPHLVIINGKKVKAQCASLIFGYSRKLFVQYYPRFTRFEAKVFLSEAFRFMGGSCKRCIIDNTSVIVLCDTGPDAQITPEMEAFGRIYSTVFIPHRLNDPDRKGKSERMFSYCEGNFLAGRTFNNWQDLNNQAENWCIQTANKKEKRSLGMTPDKAFIMEKPHLMHLPPYIPPVYQTIYRMADLESYVSLDTNRYSVPEKLIGKKLEVHKYWEKVVVYHKRKKIAEHPREIQKRNTRITDPRHHLIHTRKNAHKGPCDEEKILIEESEILAQYVRELKQRSRGRGTAKLRRLLNLKQTYPKTAFVSAIEKSLHYGLFDLTRLENLILTHIAGDFFNL